MTGVFVSDLHGHEDRYRKLTELIARERPDGVFLGGDLLPSGLVDEGPKPNAASGFIDEVLAAGFASLQETLGAAYPAVFLILGNDDGKSCEPAVLRYAYAGDARARTPRGPGTRSADGVAGGGHPPAPDAGPARGAPAAPTGGQTPPPNRQPRAGPLWHYVHGRCAAWGPYRVYGYAYCPPSPFALKDWERYDVSRFVDPGCVSPEEGFYSVDVPARVRRTATIAADLQELVADDAARGNLDDALFLFHAPPYDTALDRAALDGRRVEHVPMDVHVGSIAMRRFIEARQPRITLHGHVHEAPRLTGRWSEMIGETHAFTAAHDGGELAVVRFDPAHPGAARRELV